MVLDFSSSLYLGFRHSRESLNTWQDYSSGKPAILHEPRLGRVLAAKLAQLSGCEDALLGASSIHVFWDLFQLLARDPVTFFIDSGAYPIARWALQGQAAAGSPVVTFQHLDADALDSAVRRWLRPGTRPVIVSDGYCTLCGRHAPLAAYHKRVREKGGLLVIDGTQAFGVFGGSPHPGQSYGYGGGGSLRFCAAAGPQVITVASLAKGFGVPVAFIAGQRLLLEQLRKHGESRVHCSPPSCADLSALQHALRLNEAVGDATRTRLRKLLGRLRKGVTALGLNPHTDLFPAQSFLFPGGRALQLSQQLRAAGIRSLNQQPCCGDGLTVTLIVTARHTPAHMDVLLANLAGALNHHGQLSA